MLSHAPPISCHEHNAPPRSQELPITVGDQTKEEQLLTLLEYLETSPHVRVREACKMFGFTYLQVRGLIQEEVVTRIFDAMMQERKQRGRQRQKISLAKTRLILCRYYYNLRRGKLCHIRPLCTSLGTSYYLFHRHLRARDAKLYQRLKLRYQRHDLRAGLSET